MNFDGPARNERRAWNLFRSTASATRVSRAFAKNLCGILAIATSAAAPSRLRKNGATVVDLWGGWADVARTQAWQRDTIVNFFSVSKALCAIAVLRLAERGLLDLDDRVALHWPEFAANGKDAITIRQLLSHRAALPALRDPLPDEAMLDWKRR